MFSRGGGGASVCANLWRQIAALEVELATKSGTSPLHARFNRGVQNCLMHPQIFLVGGGAEFISPSLRKAAVVLMAAEALNTSIIIITSVFCWPSEFFGSREKKGPKL